MVAIIDYDAGNILSVQKACTYLGCECRVTGERDEILAADHIILPGVGAFGDAMEKLRMGGLDGVIAEAVDRDLPFLGICLGEQLLFEESEEAPGVKGLGLLGGRCSRIPEGDGRKIPHMGWNSLSFPAAGRLFQGVPEDVCVYFVHSYYVHADDRAVVTALCDYGTPMDVSVERGNLFGCQFHPEKSGQWGLKILGNFLSVGRAERIHSEME